MARGGAKVFGMRGIGGIGWVCGWDTRLRLHESQTSTAAGSIDVVVWLLPAGLLNDCGAGGGSRPPPRTSCGTQFQSADRSRFPLVCWSTARPPPRLPRGHSTPGFETSCPQVSLGAHLAGAEPPDKATESTGAPTGRPSATAGGRGFGCHVPPVRGVLPGGASWCRERV